MYGVANVCVHQMHAWCPQRSEEGVRSSDKVVVLKVCNCLLMVLAAHVSVTGVFLGALAR